MADGTTAHPMKYNDLEKEINQSVIEGMVGAMAAFLTARRLEYTANTLMAFASKVTSEFEVDETKRTQPLPEPIKPFVLEALRQAAPTLDALDATGGHETLRKLVRVIAGGELMLILDRHPGAAIELFHSCEKQKDSGVEG